MSVLQGKVPQLSKMFWASSENQMTDEKIIFAKWQLKGILKLSTSLLQDWI